MMSLPLLFAVVIVVLYVINALNILKEYERGVIFRLGRVKEAAKGPGVIWVFRPLRPDRSRQPASGGDGGSRPGRHHPRQRHA